MKSLCNSLKNFMKDFKEMGPNFAYVIKQID